MSAPSLEKKRSVAGDSCHGRSLYTLERDSELFAVYLFSGFKEYYALMNGLIRRAHGQRAPKTTVEWESQ